MPRDKLRGSRYLTPANAWLAQDIIDEIPYLDYRGALGWYGKHLPRLDDPGRALLGCNDRFFLLTALLHRRDALNPWLFERCREVERAPDGHLDLWARYHFKSSIGTQAGIIQEILCDPEITACILSATKDLARAFLVQIQQELENKEDLKRLYPDVLWANPRKEADRWSRDDGIVVKRKANPKEATVEAHGLIDGQPTSRHYQLLVYDDVVTQDLVGNPDIMKKVTDRWELSDNLGQAGETRKQHRAGLPAQSARSARAVPRAGRGVERPAAALRRTRHFLQRRRAQHPPRAGAAYREEPDMLTPARVLTLKEVPESAPVKEAKSACAGISPAVAEASLSYRALADEIRRAREPHKLRGSTGGSTLTPSPGALRGFQSGSGCQLQWLRRRTLRAVTRANRGRKLCSIG